VAKGQLERLIDLEAEGDSDQRRAVLREVTDALMVAPDRYGHRDMAIFDLLLSRTATHLDTRLRKVLALTLVRAGAREEHVRSALNNGPSPNERFLRRSVMQTRDDLFTALQEQSAPADIEGDETLSDGNGLRLPRAFSLWIYQYQSTVYQQSLEPRIGADRARTLMRTLERFRGEIVDHATEAAQEEIILARRTIKDWTKSRTITDEVLVELLESRAMTEFIFALMSRFSLDCATTFRILNDSSFQSLALVGKAFDMRRAVFAKIITGFRHRRTDHDRLDQILPVYDKLPRETAERALRFWRIRISDLMGEAPKVVPDRLAG
jgi:hypothetical protein